MESDSTPIEQASAAAIVARAIHAIDKSTSERRDILLYDLLSAAWPEPIAQDQ
jgi:hypothetical protein